MRVMLAADPIEPGVLLTGFCAARRESGAVVSFTGLARAEAGAVSALELEAYPGFTEAAIRETIDMAVGRFALDDVLVVHRIGRIAAGEPIIFLAVCAAHRRAAFEGADCLMDYLKSRAPFWKREIGPDGARWIEPTAQDLRDAERWDAAQDSQPERT